MILFLYNTLQILALLLLSPLLLVLVGCTAKYRGRIGRRLGLGLPDCSAPAGHKVLWVHALSVGEVASVLPLLRVFKEQYPDLFLVLSTTTSSGEKFARERAEVDLILPFPLDIRWLVRSFLRRVNPDLFILIETDFWPNFLHELRVRKIPAILANGRIAADSMVRYHRLLFFFKPLFSSFTLVAMQTDEDAGRMVTLGVEPGRVASLGNLKYDAISVPAHHRGGDFHLPVGCRLLVAGSTHPGEEASILRVFRTLQGRFPNLFLVIAPREVRRGTEILEMAAQQGVTGGLRTGAAVAGATLLVLDTIGELAHIYGMAQLVFVGGSLVDYGGHNPLEASVHGKPVLFGPFMSDFQEIARELLAAGAALAVGGEEEFSTVAATLLANPEQAVAMGRNGSGLIRDKSGAARRYAAIAGSILGMESSR